MEHFLKHAHTVDYIRLKPGSLQICSLKRLCQA